MRSSECQAPVTFDCEVTKIDLEDQLEHLPQCPDYEELRLREHKEVCVI